MFELLVFYEIIRADANRIHTLLSLETDSDTQPLYSSGLFIARACIRLTAAVTTPCQHFKTSHWLADDE